MQPRLLTMAFGALSLFSFASANCGNRAVAGNVKAKGLTKSHHSHPHSHSHHHHVAKKNHAHHTSHRAAKAAKKHRASKGKKVSTSSSSPSAFAAVAQVKKVASSGADNGDDSDDGSDDASGSDGTGSDSGSDGSSSAKNGTIGGASSSTGAGLSGTSTNAMNLLSKVSSGCGFAKPSTDVTASGGPNGLQSWMGCGLDGSGWNPPTVTMNMLTVKTLEDAGDLFSPCAKYTSIFEKYGQQFNVPAIFLASFAMQESSCNPNTSGDNGGAIGLMQLTKDKCGDAPNGDCADPDFNIMMGAKTFTDGLSSSNGNVLVALGAYNGWYTGLTDGAARQAKADGCCECQQNLDYLQQFLNGWLQGVDPYSKKLGTVGNLDGCE